MIDLCTVTNKGYILKCISLSYSLIKTSNNYTLWILCIDNESYQILKELHDPHLKLVKLSQILTPKLRKIAKARTEKEFAWTLKPNFINYLLTNKKIKQIIYVDADMAFYSNVKEIVASAKNSSISISSHNFAPALQNKAKQVGEFNSGLIYFKNDPVGYKCSKEWMNNCNDFCFYKPHKLGVGDQMYLTEWPRKYPSSLKIFSNVGINFGPWRIIASKIVTKKNGDIYIDGTKLVCYHFHEFGINKDGSFIRSLGYKIPESAIQHIYVPYEKLYLKAYNFVKKLNTDNRFGLNYISKSKSLKIKIIQLLSPIYWKINSIVPINIKVKNND